MPFRFPPACEEIPPPLRGAWRKVTDMRAPAAPRWRKVAPRWPRGGVGAPVTPGWHKVADVGAPVQGWEFFSEKIFT